MSGLFQDDKGNDSSGRVILFAVLVAFLVWTSYILYTNRNDIANVFSDGFIGWVKSFLFILIGGKAGHKAVELAGDIFKSKNDEQNTGNQDGIG